MSYTEQSVGPEVVLECRQYGHQWDRVTVAIVEREYHDGLKCQRCQALRTDVVEMRGDQFGKIVRRYYVYPSEYRTVGKGKSKQALREEMLLSASLKESMA